MTNTKPTPGTWSVYNITGEDFDIQYIASDYNEKEIARMSSHNEVSAANAAHIVKCVNAYPALVNQHSVMLEALNFAHLYLSGPPAEKVLAAIKTADFPKQENKGKQEIQAADKETQV